MVVSEIDDGVVVTIVQLQRDEQEYLQRVYSVESQGCSLESQLPQLHRRNDWESDVSREKVIILRVGEAWRAPNNPLWLWQLHQQKADGAY